jgi:hypothetical protein
MKRRRTTAAMRRAAQSLPLAPLRADSPQPAPRQTAQACADRRLRSTA